ncbi:hypothetical protein TNCV_3677541 [Trichonephila clavipes]|nr:hypothetical protein TNCV_3677541 [Trichonephila clavipes]
MDIVDCLIERYGEVSGKKGHPALQPNPMRLTERPSWNKTTSIPEKNFKTGGVLALKRAIVKILHRSLRKIRKTLDLQENDESCSRISVTQGAPTRRPATLHPSVEIETTVSISVI